jgi:hypothetical protein
MTTPVGTNVGERLETMRNPMVDLLFVLLSTIELAMDDSYKNISRTPAFDLEIHFVTTSP